MKGRYDGVSKEEIQKQIGERVAMAREIAGFTQVELAKRCGITASQISLIEAGKRDTGATMIVVIAAATGVNAGRLLP